ncbi:MAG: acyltransferase [Mesorhizobium sp.]|nr:MAG: acyltransferase [Mesorhizobium sp.]
MATFNLGGLPSMQVANQNAPSSSVNIVPQGPSNSEQVQAGLASLAQAGVQGVQAYRQQESQDQLKQFQGAFGQAYAKGDREAMKALAAQYPQQFETITKGIGLVDADHTQQVGNLAADLRVASTQGPEAVAGVLTKNKDALSRLGIDPQQAAQTYQQNPEGFVQMADLIGLHALGPEKYFDVQDKRAGRDIQGQQLQETARHNQAAEGLQSQGQAITLRGQNLNAQLKLMDMQDKQLDRQIAREGNQIKLAGLQQQQQDLQSKKAEALNNSYADYQSGVSNINNTLDTVSNVLKSPGFGNFFGAGVPFASKVPGTSAADTKAQVDTLKSQVFLSAISQMKGMGALSNAEGEKLQASIANLSPDMSEKQAQRSLRTIRDTMEQARERMNQRYKPVIERYQSQQGSSAPAISAPSSQPQSAASAAGGDFSNLWGG